MDVDNVAMLNVEAADLLHMVHNETKAVFPKQRALFDLKFRNGSGKRALFLSSPMAMAVVVDHHSRFYQHFGLTDRPNSQLVVYLKEAIYLVHAERYFENSAEPSVQGFYSALNEMFEPFSLPPALLKDLGMAKDYVMHKLLAQRPESSAQYLVERVKQEANFDLFTIDFEPCFEIHQHEHEAFAKPGTNPKSRIKPAVYSVQVFIQVLAKFNLTVETMVTAFQFEAWFFGHFVSVKGDDQVPDYNWEDIVMCMLKQPTFTSFQSLKPNSTLGLHVVCGRISDPTSPDFIPASPYFNWRGNAALGNSVGSPAAESMGDAVVRVVEKHRELIGMDALYMAFNFRRVLQVMKWLIDPSNKEATTPFYAALLHYDAAVSAHQREELDRAETLAREERLEKARQRKEEFAKQHAERMLRFEEQRECLICSNKFTFLYPSGETPGSSIKNTPENQFDPDTLCDMTCRPLLCLACCNSLCVNSEQLTAGMCGDCLSTVCTVCAVPATEVKGIQKKLCTECYVRKYCPCGGEIPGYNYKFRLCTACNKCQTCDKILGSPCEQTCQQCNDCVILLVSEDYVPAGVPTQPAE